MTKTDFDIVVCGGGAAGFFTAINTAENFPHLSILILEKSSRFLDKVRISGGGRCNVTHACWEPRELVKFYPRGSKELLGPFHQFMCGDMLDWLDRHGIPTKIEEDGRIFPESNSSQTIIDCFMGQAQKFNIELRLSEGLDTFEKESDIFKIKTSVGHELTCQKLVLATGGTKTMWQQLAQKGFKIVEPVPSLFTFKIKHRLISDLPGVVAENATVSIKDFKMETNGPVLITHWGLSGPGILKLSSWAARHLHDLQYKFEAKVNWTSSSYDDVRSIIMHRKTTKGSTIVFQDNPFTIPKRLWKNIVSESQVGKKNWGDLNKTEIDTISLFVSESSFITNGKATNKDEFVTSGGVSLEEINFKNMESKRIPNLHLAGEILNIDALTGGFNFQAAWTESWIIAKNMTQC